MKMRVVKDLRIYKEDTPQYYFYKEQHEKQTLDFVNTKQNIKLGREILTMSMALSMLDNFVDPSDPDVSCPNSFHAYQTAERIRKQFPNDYPLQICGLIHDIGKILFSFGEPNWAVVGDTFAVGCGFPESIVYFDTMKANPDYGKFDSFGIYPPMCGIEQLKLSFGHDEYLYKVLQEKENQSSHKLSKKYQNIIRFHSFYPWHTGGDYQQFEKESDAEIKDDVLLFNQFDLYSKQDGDFILTDEIKQYYDVLLQEYFPEPLKW